MDEKLKDLFREFLKKMTDDQLVSFTDFVDGVPDSALQLLEFCGEEYHTRGMIW